MNRRTILASMVVVASVATAFAQEAEQKPSKPVVCLAQLDGMQAQDWRLIKPIANELSRRSEAQQKPLEIVMLDATSEKHGRPEAKNKNCAVQVYSRIERTTSALTTSMDPSPTRGQIGAASGGAGPTMVYSLKIDDADGKKLENSVVQVTMRIQNPRKEDFEAAGRELINKVSDKIMARVPQ